MGWLSWAETIKKNVNLKPKRISIDNVFFKLHYRMTFWLLLAFTSLVTLHESFGDKIRCTLSDPTDSRKQLEPVIDTFCFFTSTFTVPKYLTTPANRSDAAHPGVGPHTLTDEVIHHKYYQWVPYCLFFQALTFYIPHLIWRYQENGRVKSLVNGFDIVKILDVETRRRSIKNVSSTIQSRLRIYNTWISWLTFCEVLNLINVIGQWALTDRFLDYQFMDLGLKWQNNTHYNHLDAVFPKMAKCTFRKYGPSGSLQTHDALCVLSLNIVNEKIYLIFWYWLILLSVASILALLHRLVTFLLYNTSLKYNALILKWQVTRNIPSKDLVAVINNLKYSEWCFFKSLMVNLDGAASEKLLNDLADSCRKTPHGRNLSHQNPPDVRVGKDAEDYFNRETLRVRKGEDVPLTTEC